MTLLDRVRSVSGEGGIALAFSLYEGTKRSCETRRFWSGGYNYRTHRLLSEFQFRDLGLVVVDEEQRFGVAHRNV